MHPSTAHACAAEQWREALWPPDPREFFETSFREREATSILTLTLSLTLFLTLNLSLTLSLTLTLTLTLTLNGRPHLLLPKDSLRTKLRQEALEVLVLSMSMSPACLCMSVHVYVPNPRMSMSPTRAP